MLLLACAIESDKRQGLSQQIRETQMGGEKLPGGSSLAWMWLWEPGWSQHWQSVWIDGWTKLGTGCENGWGQRGNLTQTNRMKDREELPAKVFQHSEPTAIYLLLTEHRRILCIFADFLKIYEETKQRRSLQIPLSVFYCHLILLFSRFTHTQLIQTEYLIIFNKFTQYAREK